MFVDQIKVHARAGKGGDGSAHFHRGKFRPKGGPDGGDGGNGGSLILLVDPSTDSLRNYVFNNKLIAEDGAKGGATQCTGTILRSQWVLTAAHCVEGETPTSLKIRLSDTDINDTAGGTEVAVAAIHANPGYDGVAWDDDVAVIELAAPVTDVVPTPIHRGAVAFGQRVHHRAVLLHREAPLRLVLVGAEVLVGVDAGGAHVGRAAGVTGERRAGVDGARCVAPAVLDEREGPELRGSDEARRARRVGDARGRGRGVEAGHVGAARGRRDERPAPAVGLHVAEHREGRERAVSVGVDRVAPGRRAR